ncbi:MAG: sigma-70 family RNA polymerase sigma factor [Planctomycetota bacterium]
MTSLNPDTVRSSGFDALVEPHLDCLFRAARRLLPSDDLASDAVQTLLLRTWQNFELPENPRSVLLSLVPNVAREVRRSERRRQHHETAAVEQIVDSTPSAEEHHAHCDHPECTTERQELRSLVRQAVLELPNDLRPLVERCWLDGETYAEAAEELDLPVGTVRSRLNRARRLLRASFERREGAQNTSLESLPRTEKLAG